ncbi:hypothetical protein DAT35_16855 [Vitiosangium sp. GDMCC 1.1324]|nr:hypothetical protein DAT35_16855 [Vitiosangium sp. GDMCC 1.1324]
MFVVVLELMGCGGGIEAPEPQQSLEMQEQAHRHGDDSDIRWIRQTVGTDFETGGDTAIDRDGNTVVVGAYKGNVTLDEDHMLPAPTTGFPGAYMVKYGKDGRVLWARAFAVSGPDVSLGSISVDSHRRINVVGSSGFGADLGGGPLSGGPFLAQFSPAGELLWSRSGFYQGVFGNFATSPTLAVDRDDRIILAGSMIGTLDFGGGPRTVPTEGETPFLAVYTRSGRYVWDRVFPGSGAASFRDVDTDENGNIFAVGLINGAFDLGGGILSSPEGSPVSMVAKFSNRGEHRWSKRVAADSGTLQLNGLAVQDNRLVVVGSLDGTLGFHGDTLTGKHGVLLAYTLKGAESWARTLSSGFLIDVAATRQDDLTVLGFAFFDPGSDIDISGLPAGLGGYLFVARYGSERGERHWVRTVGWSALSLLQPYLAASREGGTAVSGSFNEPVYFGTETLTPTTPGIYDAFLLRLGP